MAESGIRSFIHQRMGINYFHGLPGVDSSHDELMGRLVQQQTRFTKIRVSHSAMANALEENGLGHKVALIRIPINLDVFRPRTEDDYQSARARLGFSPQDFVLGSFQKDGQGWGDGTTPKKVKGPDFLLQVASVLKSAIGNRLFVLLSGPARGFVMAGLRSSGIRFRHVNAANAREMVGLYDALDAYLIPSRDEGGPKGLLESMAIGVPVVSTFVGQAADLIVDGANGWLTQFDPVEATEKLLRAGSDPLSSGIVMNARRTAAQHSHLSQLAQWLDFFGAND